MIGIIRGIKTRIGLTVSSFLSALGAGSSTATAVCQTTCSTGSALPFFLGFTLSATPLAFIGDYQLPLWWISFAVFSVLLVFFVKKVLYSKTDKAFMFLNGGLLLIGFPYFREKLTLLPWVGLTISIFGLYLLLTARRIIVQWTQYGEKR